MFPYSLLDSSKPKQHLYMSTTSKNVPDNGFRTSLFRITGGLV